MATEVPANDHPVMTSAPPTRSAPSPTPRRQPAAAPPPVPADGGEPVAPAASTEPRAAERAARVTQRPGFGNPATGLVVGKQPPPRPTARELNTDGIPIQKPRGLVPEIHRKRLLDQQVRRDTAVPASPPPATEAAPEPPPGELPPPPRERPLAAAAEPSRSPAPRGEARRPPGETNGGPARAAVNGEAATGHVRAAGPPLGNGAAPAIPAPRASQREAPTPSAQSWREAAREQYAEYRCGTCRDFRPSDNPALGRCVNTCAFTTPQVVSAEDLACLNVVGSWWAPSDGDWLSAAAAGPVRETPLTDAFLEEIRSPYRRIRRQ